MSENLTFFFWFVTLYVLVSDMNTKLRGILKVEAAIWTVALIFVGFMGGQLSYLNNHTDL